MLQPTLMKSLGTLGALAQGRLESAPQKPLMIQMLPVEGSLEGFRQRNQLLDWVFYDIDCISAEEANSLGSFRAREGNLLLVPPSGSGPLRPFRTVDAFVQGGGTAAQALAVAGVGSSALGAAAFARNIADAKGVPVCAVVSGYGLADALTEAMGGFFWFSAFNRFRHVFEGLDWIREARAMERESEATSDRKLSSPLLRSEDVRAVVGLLNNPALNFSLLTGHSKGNLVLSEALFDLQRGAPARMAELGSEALVVTFSAKVAMPAACREVTDVLGALDGFGLFNSTPGIRTDVLVPGAWHHTNTSLDFSLDVKTELSHILAARSEVVSA
jgi:hypothetical protein